MVIRQAVILAAGKGKRMKEGSNDPYILSTPKPLLKVRGGLIIERIVSKLVRASVKVGIVVNPNEEKLFRAALKEYDVTYCYQNEPKGTAHAVYAAKDFVKDDLFLVFMGDDVSEYDLQGIIDSEVPLILGFEVDEVKDYGALVIDSEGYAEKVLEKESMGHGLANSGIYVLPRSFFEFYAEISPNLENSEYYLTDAVNILYKRGQPLLCRKLDYWRGINRLSDLNDETSLVNKYLQLRNVEEEDMESLLLLLSQLSLGTSLNQELNKVREQLITIIQDSNTYMIVAEHEGAVVGTATLLVQINLSHGGRPYGHIENVVTKDDLRGIGIGTAMISELVRIGKQVGCYKIILDCRPENAPFYQKCGFKTTGEIEMRLDP